MAHFHKSAVTQAVRSGKPVPAEVLADYPDLAAAHPEAAKFTGTAANGVRYVAGVPQKGEESGQSTANAVDTNRERGSIPGQGAQSATPDPEVPKMRLRDEMKPLVGREIKTPSGNVLKTVELDSGYIGFLTAQGGRQSISDTKPLDRRQDAKAIDSLKARGLDPSQYVKMGAVLMHQDTADQLQAVRDQARKVRQAAFAANVPGLSELQSSRDEQDRYSSEFARMMDDESNDGARPPRGPSGSSYSDLSAKFPRAAMYLKAEAYGMSSHPDKNGAGKRAMQMILDGEPLDAVQKVLDNWLPASAFDN